MPILELVFLNGCNLSSAHANLFCQKKLIICNGKITLLLRFINVKRLDYYNLEEIG